MGWTNVAYEKTDGANTITVHMNVNYGYTNVVRSGNTVSVDLGMSIEQADGYYCYNSIGGRFNGVVRYGFVGDANHYTSRSTVYCKDTSGSPGYKNTSEIYPWHYSFTVNPSDTSATVYLDYSWQKFDLTDDYNSCWVSKPLTITFPALTGPTINSASVSGGLGTASYSCSASAGSSSSLSYSWTIGGKSASGTSGTVTGLSQNKSYTWSLTVTDGNGMTATRSGTFITTHTAPNIGTRTITHTRVNDTYTTKIAYPVTYSGGASYSSHSLKYSTTSGSYTTSATSASTGTSSSFNLTGLEPNKTYYYQITEVDNGLAQTKSATATGSFKTPCQAPSGITQRSLGSSKDMIGISYSGEGDINAPITKWTIKYRKASGTTQTTIDAGTSTTYWIDGLDPDTDYKIDVWATNVGGDSNSGEYNYATKMDAPTITSFTVSNLQPFSCTLTAQATSNPTRVLNYRFSKDDGSTWTSYQTSNVYNWTGLTEETLYKFQVQVKAISTADFGTDTTATASVQATTPSDQARIRGKVNGSWVQGKAYYKVNGTWVKAKKVYIKKNGAWVINKNN